MASAEPDFMDIFMLVVLESRDFYELSELSWA